MADWAKFMMPNYQLFKDVSTKSKPIVDGREIEISIPWKQIVTMRGNVPWIKGDNDGTVTVGSMTSRSDVQNIRLDANHTEVLLSREVIDIVRQDFFG